MSRISIAERRASMPTARDRIAVRSVGSLLRLLSTLGIRDGNYELFSLRKRIEYFSRIVRRKDGAG